MRPLLLLILALFAPLTTLAESVDDLSIYTEIYPPMNYVEDGMVKGFSTDLMAAMLKELHSTKTLDDIKVLPWTRGYHIVTNKKDTLLFSMTRTPQREDLFKWVGPIIQTEVALIARKDAHIHITDDAELDNYRIGIVENDVGHLLLKELGVKDDKLVRANSGEHFPKMLAAGRIDMCAYDKNVEFWFIKNSPEVNLADFEVVKTLKQSGMYYALNKDTDDAVVTRLQGALDTLRERGVVDEIIQRYVGN